MRDEAMAAPAVIRKARREMPCVMRQIVRRRTQGAQADRYKLTAALF
jgi:hypothetical protein